MRAYLIAVATTIPLCLAQPSCAHADGGWSQGHCAGHKLQKIDPPFAYKPADPPSCPAQSTQLTGQVECLHHASGIKCRHIDVYVPIIWVEYIYNTKSHFCTTANTSFGGTIIATGCQEDK